MIYSKITFKYFVILLLNLILLGLFTYFCSIELYVYMALIFVFYTIFLFPLIFLPISYFATKNLYFSIIQNSLNLLLSLFLYEYLFVKYFDDKGNGIFNWLTYVSIIISFSVTIILSIFYIKKRFSVKNAENNSIKNQLRIYGLIFIIFLAHIGVYELYDHNKEQIVAKLRSSDFKTINK